jgi:predicted protein tyrosine phosphatase
LKKQKQIISQVFTRNIYYRRFIFQLNAWFRSDSIGYKFMNLVDLLTLLTQMMLFLVLLAVLFRASPLTLGLRVFDQMMLKCGGTPTKRLSRITPQLYVGGQHSERGWARMQAMGITAIVNMREAQYDDRANGIAPERYLHLPTIDHTAPSMQHLRQGIEFIRAEIDHGGTVYIHCASGVGRAPTMAAAYLISTGLSLKEALVEIKRVRPFVRPREPQRRQLERFALEMKT